MSLVDGWERRRITLVGSRDLVERHCADWAEAGWRVLDVVDAGVHAGPHPCFAVTVLVPPHDWRGHLDRVTALTTSVAS